ncbi:MAG TPA: acetylxylan esterase [Fimbriimonas sp.]|nr:acetylxylan esterase [Fimbriimonas sp.]
MRTPCRFSTCFIFAALLSVANAQQPMFEQNVSASDHLRSEQAQELDAYVQTLAADKSRLHALFHPDFSSVGAYENSTKALRSRYAESIGYPPPGEIGTEKASFVPMGEDSLGTYYRAQIPVVKGVHAEGIYIVPKGVKGKIPLVISMHGGGGSPEVALFNGGANYHDMVRGAVKRGYAVFAPQHLFNAAGYPADVRNQIDERLRLVGTSITAIEIAKITRSLDVLLKRPEIDPKRVAMVGLSYGGYYALVTPALEPRIKVVVSSCYFGVQEFRYRQSDLTIPSDFQSMDRFTLFRDPEIVALICPRPLLIQAGKNDDAPHRDMGIELAPEAASYYRNLGKTDAFKFLVFEGSHEFDDASAWEFIRRYL